MREVFESFKAAIVRMFDSWFIASSERSDEVFWYRTQLAAKDIRIKELTDQLTAVPQKEQEEEYTAPQPVMPRHVPWSVEQRRREKLDREKFEKMREEMKATTTEKLETELLGEAAK